LGVTAKKLHGSTSKPGFKLFARNMKEISLLGSGVMILTYEEEEEEETEDSMKMMTIN
jgi:hypothetical protein